MCVILSIFQKEFNQDIIQALASAVEKLEWINDDGTGIVGFNLDSNRTLIQRKMKVSEAEFHKV